MALASEAFIAHCLCLSAQICYNVKRTIMKGLLPFATEAGAAFGLDIINCRGHIAGHWLCNDL